MGRVSFLRFYEDGKEVVLARAQDRPEYFFYREKDKPDHTRIRFSRIWSPRSLWTPQYVISGGSPSHAGRWLALLALDRSNVGTRYIPKQDLTIATLASAKTELQKAVRDGRVHVTPIGEVTAISRAEADAWLRRSREIEARAARDRAMQERKDQAAAQQRSVRVPDRSANSVLFDSEFVKIIPTTEYQKNWCLSEGLANVSLALKVDIYFSFSPFNADYTRVVDKFVLPAVRAHCGHNLNRINLRNYVFRDGGAPNSGWERVNWLQVNIRDGRVVGMEFQGSNPEVTTSYQKQKLDIEQLRQEADEISRGLTGRY